MILQRAEPQSLKPVVDFLPAQAGIDLEVPGRMLAVGAVEAADFKTERGIVRHRGPGQETVVLENEPGLGTRPRQGAAVDVDSAPFGPEEAGQQVEQAGFAAARGPDNGHGLTARHLQAEVFEEGGASAVGKRDGAEFNHRMGPGGVRAGPQRPNG